MIALLRGVLIDKHPNQAIVETAGVGYDVTIPVSTFTGLPDAGAEVRLRIHTHVREDALSLYGFLTQDEKALFEKLIGVSGIGPKLAVTILSGLAAPDLINSIRRGEVDRLVRIPGIGKKTAERMVLELRDKLPAVSGEEPAAPAAALSAIEQDVLSALLNLGCGRPQAEAGRIDDRAPYVVAALNGDVDNHADLKAAEGLRIPVEVTTDAKVIPMMVASRLGQGC
jgi:Holliday junction DNA helicase RuvA